MVIVEFNPASPECSPQSIAENFSGDRRDTMQSLVVRCDYDHPITKKPYARAFYLPDVTFLFAMLHEETDSLITAKLGELIGLSLMKECNQADRPDIVRWLRSKTVIVEHRAALTDLALLVNLEKPLDFLDRVDADE